MNEAAAKLASRVIRWVIAASIVTTVLLVGIVPNLLLLRPGVALAATDRELLILSAAGLLGLGLVAARLDRHRYLLRALAFGSRSIEASEMEELSHEPGRLSRRWLVPHLVALSVLVTPARPDEIDLPTGTSLAMLGAIIAAAISLLLYVVVRTLFLRAAELAPSEIMREVIEVAERHGRARSRVQRRLRTAVLTPVALVAVGAALISSADVRHADEVAREATARVVGRAAFESNPGVVAEAGRDAAIARAAALGYRAAVSSEPMPYRADRDEEGLTVLSVPLDAGSVELRFNGTNIPVLGFAAIVLSLFTIGVAAALGSALGRAHTLDLQRATEGIRVLGTEAAIRGGRLPVRPPQFRVVGEIERGIEHVAERFGVFAQAQERAISAREAATRMRGLFFASVSHDLKSPLNAILGFAELVRAEPLTSGQLESLDVIERRGRELLALIETILDAARVEAKQLAVVVERIPTRELLQDSLSKARELESDLSFDASFDLDRDLPALVADRVRMTRALATLVVFAVRQSRTGSVHVRVARDGDRHASLEMAIAGRRGVRELARLLKTAGKPGAGEHRGMSLALSLSSSIIELHHGTLEAVESASGDAAFLVKLPLPGA